MAERVNEESGMELPSDRILYALETGVNSLKAVLTRIGQHFSIPDPRDEILDQGTGKASKDESSLDPISVELLARIAQYGNDRFHTPFQ